MDKLEPLDNMDISLPRGMRDFSTDESIIRNKIVEGVEKTYKRFGFQPLDTPAIETLEALNAKNYGEEATKEMYIFENDKEGLRFDLTVPLARYIALNKNVPLPFKRYQIGKTWRREEPQRMRYREFLQADADIVGSSHVASDAEIIAVGAKALEAVGIEDYTILINDRIVLENILSYFSVPKEKQSAAIRILDKLYKFNRSEIIDMLKQLGLDQRKCEDMIEFLSKEENTDQKIQRIAANIPNINERVNKIKELFAMLANYELKGIIDLDLTVARGLDYYTSFVFEIIKLENTKRSPSLAAGGRYDKLIGTYANKDMEATGISIGIDRIFDIIYAKDEKFIKEIIFIAHITQEDNDAAFQIAKDLRKENFNVYLDITERNISKQMEYANAQRFAKAIIVGKQERAANKIKIRNLITGKEELLDMKELINYLKEGV